MFRRCKFRGGYVERRLLAPGERIPSFCCPWLKEAKGRGLLAPILVPGSRPLQKTGPQ